MARADNVTSHLMGHSSFRNSRQPLCAIASHMILIELYFRYCFGGSQSVGQLANSVTINIIALSLRNSPNLFFLVPISAVVCAQCTRASWIWLALILIQCGNSFSGFLSIGENICLSHRFGSWSEALCATLNQTEPQVTDTEFRCSTPRPFVPSCDNHLFRKQ